MHFRTVKERALSAAQAARECDWDRALDLLDFDWRQEDADAANLAGAALLHLGLAGDALAALQHAANAPGLSDRGACLLNLARALTLTGEADAALSRLAEAEPLLPPGLPLLLLSRAEVLVALGRPEDALALVPDDVSDVALVQMRVVLLGATLRHPEAAELLNRAMAAHSQDISLFLMASELAAVRGHTGEALDMLDKALALKPDDVGLLAQQAMLASQFKIGPIARTAVARALAVTESHADPIARAIALCAEAHLLATDGLQVEAEAKWRAALTHGPDLVPALSGLGNHLLTAGRVDEALELFRRVSGIAPLQGWSQLIHAREVPDDPAVLEQIEQAARQPGLEGPVRSSLLFLLSMAHDRLKNYDRAFAAATQANEAVRALLRYSPARHRVEVDRIMARFSPEFIATRSNWGNPSEVPVFIVGMPRSGTTLAEQILAGHSQVHGAGELSLSGDLVTRFNLWEQKLGSGWTYPECLADLTPAKARQLADHWLVQLRERDSQARYVVDKLPHNFEHIGLIKLLFPNARVLSCLREPRDVAVSNFMTDYAAKFGGMGFAYDLAWIGEQLVDHRRLMDHWQALFPDSILEVGYEDTVTDTEAQARRMLAFLGLEWEPAVLEFQSVDRPVKTASSWQVRQPVYTTSKARWRNYADHLLPLEAALADIPSSPAPLPQPTLAPGRFFDGMALLNQGHADEAGKVFLEVIAAQPNHAAAYHFLGVAQAQIGRLSEGRDAVRHAVALHGLHAAWFENLAKIEHALGNVAAAQAAAVRAGELRQVQVAGQGG